MGIVKYNAFKGMGGNLSFALALLDYTNTGFVINSVHSREGCYLYIKDVDRGQTDVALGNEEKMALEQALGYKEYSCSVRQQKNAGQIAWRIADTKAQAVLKWKREDTKAQAALRWKRANTKSAGSPELKKSGHQNHRQFEVKERGT